MSANITNQVAYIRTSRVFPDDKDELKLELTKAYIDTANAVNARTIGIYPKNVAAITGNGYYFNNQKQQTLRQVYTFTGAGNIAHQIKFFNPGMMVQGFGSYTDGTNDYGVIYGSSVAIAGQVSFYVTTTNIVVLLGAGAPAITSGSIVIEWLAAKFVQ